jgi:hypothetical protein
MLGGVIGAGEPPGSVSNIGNSILIEIADIASLRPKVVEDMLFGERDFPANEGKIERGKRCNTPEGGRCFHHGAM